MKSCIYAIIFLTLVPQTHSALCQEVNLKGAKWESEILRLPPGDSEAVRPVKLTYHLAWKKMIKAAAAEIVINRSTDRPDCIHCTARGGSAGMARSIYPYSFNCSSLIDSSSLMPISFSMHEETRKNRHENRIAFPNLRAISVRKSTDKKTNQTKEREKSFLFGTDLVRDAFSVLLCGRKLSLPNGEELSVVLVPIDQPYLIRFKVLGREIRRLKGKNYRTIKLDLFVGRVNDDGSIKPFDKLQGATIWLIDDAERYPLELKADLFVGNFSAYLVDKEYLR